MRTRLARPRPPFLHDLLPPGDRQIASVRGSAYGHLTDACARPIVGPSRGERAGRGGRNSAGTRRSRQIVRTACAPLSRPVGRYRGRAFARPTPTRGPTVIRIAGVFLTCPDRAARGCGRVLPDVTCVRGLRASVQSPLGVVPTQTVLSRYSRGKGRCSSRSTGTEMDGGSMRLDGSVPAVADLSIVRSPGSRSSSRTPNHLRVPARRRRI